VTRKTSRRTMLKTAGAALVLPAAYSRTAFAAPGAQMGRPRFEGKDTPKLSLEIGQALSTNPDEAAAAASRGSRNRAVSGRRTDEVVQRPEHDLLRAGRGRDVEQHVLRAAAHGSEVDALHFEAVRPAGQADECHKQPVIRVSQSSFLEPPVEL